MKKYLLILILFICTLITSCTLPGQNQGNNNNNQNDIYYKVYFDSYYGSFVEPLDVKEGEIAIKPIDPTKENFRFLYWTLNNVEYDFNTPITSNITLVAKWEEVLTHVHSYNKEVVEPTCNESGYTLYICVCGDTYKEDIVASLDHDVVIHDKKDPTCTEVGWDTYITCNNCDYSTYKELPALDHDEVQHYGKEATCIEIGHYDYVTCTRCSYTTYEEIEALGHDEVYHDAKEPTEIEIGWEAYITCNRCTHSTYEEIPATGVEIYEKDGKKFFNFGSYPQTHVNDTELINELNKLTTINSRGYYEYNGAEYAKVTTKPYKYGAGYTYSTGKIVENSVTEWFKVEPIIWRILSDTNGTYQVLSEYILDQTQYYNNSSNRIIDGQTIYPNNYKYSDIREFLNNEFLNAAFKTSEQSLIIISEVDNSASTTVSSSNQYVCENTFDKIYLLSYQDTLNTSYDDARRAYVTDYAKAMGVLCSGVSNNIGCWWLRSPFYYYLYYSYNALCIDRYGDVYENCDVRYSNNGVRPAFSIAIQ